MVDKQFELLVALEQVDSQIHSLEENITNLKGDVFNLKGEIIQLTRYKLLFNS